MIFTEKFQDVRAKKRLRLLREIQTDSNRAVTIFLCTAHGSCCVHVWVSPLTQQQPRQSIEVSHVRVVAEDAVDPLLLVWENVVQLPLELRRLHRRPLRRGRGRRGGRSARLVPLRRTGVRPVGGRVVGCQGGRGSGSGGGGPRSGVESLDVDGLLLLWEGARVRRSEWRRRRSRHCRSPGGGDARRQ